MALPAAVLKKTVVINPWPPISQKSSTQMILTPNPKNLLPRPESGHSPDPAPYPDITLLTPSPIHSAFTCEVSSHSFFKFSFCVK